MLPLDEGRARFAYHHSTHTLAHAHVVAMMILKGVVATNRGEDPDGIYDIKDNDKHIFLSIMIIVTIIIMM